MISVEIVESKKQRKEFADFPGELYKGHPYYIPCFYSDTMTSMDPRKNPSLEYSEARFFLAKEDGKTVGRIGAIINHKADQKWKNHRMRFWQVDFIDDYCVSKALFDAVEKWAVEENCDAITGPMGFTDLDLEGMLVDGYEEYGIFCTYYNYPYYSRHLEALGYEKEADWVEYKLDLTNNDVDFSTVSRMAEFSQRVYKLHLKECSSVRDIGNAAPEIINLINLTYKDLYSTTDLDIEHGASYFKSFQVVLNPSTSALVYNEAEELVGFVLAIPDISAAVKKSNGKIFPFGWFRILRKIKKNDEYIALLIGVHPDYQSKGVITILINRLMEGFKVVGAKTCRVCPMLEDNAKVLSLMKIAPSSAYKRRRSFIKVLKPRIE